MPARAGFDVVISGASIAGCAAARLFGLTGARVALVERRPDPAAYKVACTHQIQSSAVPTIERLGLAPLLEQAGAVRSRAAAWTPYGGWLRFPADVPPGYGITRRSLDPIVRELAAGTPGVEYFPGQTVVRLRGDGGRVSGVEVETPDHKRRTLSARLTVAADGRDSTIARLARVPARVRPHNRFVYFAYWRGVRSPKTKARVWMLDPDAAAVFPNEGDVTVIAAVPHNARLPEFRADPEAAYGRMVGALPDGPEIAGAERVSKLIGKLEMPNKMRPAAHPGVAFIGDAALAIDPLFGVGCGWAFQGAEWLVDETGSALLDHGDLDIALKRYGRAFWRRLGPHHMTGPRLSRSIALLFHHLSASRLVTIAQIEGRVRGAGSEFALACDMRFAARESAIFGQFEPAFGLLPGGGAAQHLTRLMGRARALEVMLCAEDYDAELAERYGWINRALAADALGEFVRSIAHRIAGFPAAGQVAVKDRVNAIALAPAEDFRRDSDLFGEGVRDPDAQSRIGAALKSGLQTRDAEMALARMLGDLADR